MPDLVQIKLNARLRLAIAAAVLVLAVGCFYSVRWQIGNMLASATRFDDANAGEVAEAAIRLAPADPSGYGLLASLETSPQQVIELAREAVRRSPFDHRTRVALARAYESEELFAEAEMEFRRAIDLAPTNAAPRWHYGNFLLRRDRESDALANLKIAADDNEDYRDQVYSLVWEYYGRDASKLSDMIGDRPASIARATYFLAGRGYAVEAVRNWNRLNTEDRIANREVARAIAQGLFGQRHFEQALEFAQNYGIDAASKPETVTNSSFEKPIDTADETMFAWRLTRGDPRIEIAQDSRLKRTGNRSLRINFRGFTRPDIPNLNQYVVVRPNTRYRVTLWVRTENLRSPGLPFIEIVDGRNDMPLARTKSVASGTTDWQESEAEFLAPPDSTGIYIRVGRESCGDDCLLNGLLWIDDIEITRR